MEKIPPPEQNKKEQELNEIRERFPLPPGHEQDAEKVKELHDIILKASKSDEAIRTLLNFAISLDKKYPDARKYCLFHVISGSTMVETSKFDFEGEDSIEKFLKSLAL